MQPVPKTKDENKYNKNPVFSVPGLVALFLAIAPVMDPYIIASIGTGFTIRANDFLILFLCVMLLGKSKKFNLRYGFLLAWCLIFLIFTILAIIGIDKQLDYLLSFKCIFLWSFYAIAINILWQGTERNKFFVYVEYIALFAAIVVIWQFIAGNIGIRAWNGRLPGLPLGKYDSWSGYIDKNTGDIRPCGIFQESSYVGIYFLVAFANAIMGNKLYKALLFAAVLFMSSSMIAVFGCLIVTVYLMVFGKKLGISNKTIKRLMIFVVVAMLLFILLITYSESVRSTFLYIHRRTTNIEADLNRERSNSAQIRILGNIDKFPDYQLWQKLFGVGTAQYASYFNVISYSNVFVTLTLNHGILGICCFIVCLISLHKRIPTYNKAFFLITMIIFATDLQWFNWYFFYMLTACILPKRTCT